MIEMMEGLILSEKCVLLYNGDHLSKNNTIQYKAMFLNRVLWYTTENKMKIEDLVNNH